MAYNKEKLRQHMERPAEDIYKCDTCPYCNGERDPTPRYPKPTPFEFWEKIGAPKYTVAPMVDQSELPFRMLCRKYGATLAYTPMFHSRSFMESATYRKEQFSTCPEDRPLFVQFCGHEADTVLAAAKFVEEDCDAVDLNLGCPQGIARRGFYGSFLMEHWDIVHTIIHTLAVELKCPVTAKMRLFDDEDLTLKYAKMLVDAGAYVVGVHGRTREMKGQDTGMANLDMIRKVQAHIGHRVPVIENGNILTFADVHPAIEKTNTQGVMSAEALLWDPRLFSNPARPVLTGRTFHMDKETRLDAIQTALDYLECVKKYPEDLGKVKAHLFKILYHSYEVHVPYRHALGDFNCTEGALETLIEHVEKLREEEINCPLVGSLPRLTNEEKKAEIEAAKKVEDCDYCIEFV